MPTSDKKALYEGRRKQFSEELKQVKSRLEVAALLRLAVFLGTIVAVYFYHDTAAVGVGIALAGVVVFVLLIRQFADLRDNRDRLTALVALNQQEAAATEFSFDGIEDGKEYLDGRHPYSYDLDIFGANSIFQYLNRTASLVGKDTLAAWLSTPLMDVREIKARQETVKELAPMLDWRQEWQALGAITHEQEDGREKLQIFMFQPEIILHTGVWKILRFVLPTVTIGMFALAIFDIVPWNAAIACYLLQLGVVGIYLKKINELHKQLGEQVQALEKYGKLLKRIEGQKFSSAKMNELQAVLNRNGTNAAARLSDLSNIMARLDSRSNVLGAMMTNGFLLWDIQTVLKLERWKDNNTEDPTHWFVVAGEVDALCCLANMAYNREQFTYPEPVANYHFEAVQAGHPLLKESVRADNDIVINGAGSILLTTGANMAGKSTFLRTVGVNLILAMAGGPVCAKEFKFTPVALCTAMRTHDSLQQQESFFHAELKRLQMIIEKLRKGDTVFVLLDEMLKGTNSSDQHTGSKALIEQLIRLKACGLVATHDLQLGELEHQYPKSVRNVCFEIAIENDELVFDYKLRPGVSRNLNATFLMRKMGITI